MVIILLSFLVLIPACLGLGMVVLSLFDRVLSTSEFKRESYLGEVGIVGMIAYTWLGVLIHFFSPVTHPLSLLLIVLGWIAFLFKSKELFPKLALNTRWEFPLFCLLLWIGLSTGAYYSGLPYYYDSVATGSPFLETDLGGYHLPTMNWVKQSALPLGVSNLYGPLAQNMLWYVLGGVFWMPGLELAPSLLLNAFLSFFYLIFLYEKSMRTTTQSLSTVFSLILLASAFLFSGMFFNTYYFIYGNLGNPMADFPVIVFTFMLATYFLDPLAGSKRPVFFILFAVFAFMCKLSGIPLTLFAFVYGVRALFDKTKPVERKAVRFGVTLACILGSIWMIRGIGLSGCLIYPEARSCFYQLPWTSTFELNDAEKHVSQWDARAAGKHYSEGMDGKDWFPFWWQQLWKTATAPRSLSLGVLGVFIALSALIYKPWRRKILAPEKSKASVLFALLIFGLGYWFLLAPGLRFGMGYFISFFLMILAVAVYAHQISETLFRYRRPFVALVFAVFLLKTATMTKVFRSGFFTAHWPRFPDNPAETKLSANQFPVNTPKYMHNCYAIDPPCASKHEIDENLLVFKMENRFRFELKKN